ncbi:CubicO group peptidase, beta-lactamase class C family [Parapedobacter composti]|uniref:CubicO group peptidase, beta-lactamase class C family n=1 Tax=Parapedobacter composti TaxID=623281 RepID=A0A1I1E891_9SPHI|nr:serine hydrolase domain-containing protein [Parapedobacter composti]SFB83277.1 CubicO group peptidase, beta-lactamase class C family [Parapedobacter composti]
MIAVKHNWWLLIFLLLGIQRSYGQPDIESRLLRILDETQIPGIQIAHLKDGQIHHYNIGEAVYGARKAVSRNSVFQTASLSKVVFAYTVLRLYDKGLLDLDRPLLEYMPYERLRNEQRGNRMTARMVLNHTTGLPNWQVSTSNPNWKTSELKAAFEPGAHYRYSGEGFYWLQLVVEHLTQKNLQQVVEEEVFEPLRLKHSSYVWVNRMERNAVVGHKGLEPYGLRKTRHANAAFSLRATASDYLRFVTEALIKGKGLKPETHKMMLAKSSSGQPADKVGEAYEHLSFGLGVLLQENERGKAVIHTGSNPGFRNFFIAYPDTGEALVCFTNSTNGEKIREEVARILLGNQTFWFTQR